MAVLSVLTAATLSIGIASCQNGNDSSPLTNGDSHQATDGKDGQDGEDGVDGLTPYIGENGNWWIGDTDTGVKAAGTKGDQGEKGDPGEKGDQGEKGEDGQDGVGIEKVEFDKDGNLVITFTDGSTQTVEMPKQETHVHTFGEWTAFSEDSPCDNKLFFRICSECKSIEWEQRANSGHDWQTEYSYDDSFHWIACNNCDEVKDKAKHVLDNSGKCNVCQQTIATPGVNYRVSEGGKYAEVSSYTGTAIDVVISDTYKGLPVTNIQEDAFEAIKIASITIPDSITSIGSGAFDYCCKLTSVYITDMAAWCNISFDSAVSNPLCYAKKLYLNNELVTELTIPDSVTEIKPYAFYGYSSLTSVTIGDSVTSIGDYAFLYCSSLTSVTIGDSVTSIGHHAFSSCSSLTSVYYKGSSSDWAKISIDFYNFDLADATRYYYSESEPALNDEETAYNGNYWRYVNGEATPWVYDPNAKLYSYAVLSDVHHEESNNHGGIEDFQNAVSKLNKFDLEFAFIAGDIGYYSTTAEMNYYSTTAATANFKFYPIRGNHDTGFTDEVWKAGTGVDENFEIVKGNDVFLGISMFESTVGQTNKYENATLDEPFKENADWLIAKLAEHKGKRITIIMHLPMPGGAGMKPDVTYGFSNASTEDDELWEAIQAADNVTIYSGHTHYEFAVEEVYPNINVCDVEGKNITTVHVPSVAYPRNSTGGELNEKSECYIVDVYRNKTVLRAFDLRTGAFMEDYVYTLHSDGTVTRGE